MRSQKNSEHAVFLTLQLPEDMFHVVALRHTARCLTDSLGIGRQDGDDIELILAELATNAVRHARGGGYAVTMAITDDTTVIEVADNGPGFSRDAVTPPGMPRYEDQPDGVTERIGGYGLPLVIALSDQVDIEANTPHGTRIRARKTITRAIGDA